MQKAEPLIHENYYHIYNCGINGAAIFKKSPDYERFLNLYEKYITSIADTYAWCLIGNHFHFLVRIKPEDEIGYYLPLNLTESSDLSEFKGSGTEKDSSRFKTTTDLSIFTDPDKAKLKKPEPSRHFSHLFNSYSKYFNNLNSRHGALFERTFKRKRIDSETYLKKLVIYIHNNPVHHGFCSHAIEYPWSSYATCLSDNTTWLKQQTVIDLFDDASNFEFVHRKGLSCENEYSLE